MWSEPILCVDMDAFFVEVERLRDPSLRDRPVAVGGGGRRGVIASASYEARRHGVRSAQATAVARRHCPDLIVVPPNHSRYSGASAQVFDVLRCFTPLVEALSLDEAFLDVSGLHRHYETPVEVGGRIRSTIKARTGLPASVGVAASKLVAKLASEKAKPDGLLWVPKNAEQEFLRVLPVESLWGVGPATLAGLARLGVATVGDLADLPEATLERAMGPAMGRHLHDLALGVDPRRVEAGSLARSLSVERTYETDLVGLPVIETALLALCDELASRLRRNAVAGRTVTLKVRFPDFLTVTRSVTVESPVASLHQLNALARSLLERTGLDRPVRLLGLGVSNMVEAGAPRQLSVLEDPSRARLDDAIAEVRRRFGSRSVVPARLVGKGGPAGLEAPEN